MNQIIIDNIVYYSEIVCHSLKDMKDGQSVAVDPYVLLDLKSWINEYKRQKLYEQV